MSSAPQGISNAKWIVIIAALALIAGLAWAGPRAGAQSAPPAVPAPSAKIDPWVLGATAGGQSTSVVILLADQADLSAAYAMADQDARGWYVYNTLTAHAARTQAGLRALLDAQGIPYRSFWAANALIATGDRALIDLLAARADVGKIEPDHASRAIEPLQAEPEAAAAPDAVEWGVQNVNAPAVWALGYRGQGIIIGNQDTGMRWTHQAIKNQYRGWNGSTADHNYNWWDSIHVTTPDNPCGTNTTAPCDDDDLLGGGHCTHTTGTITGDDGSPGPNQIGVAPAARWMGCRNMDRGVGRPPTYLECFQFFLAPTNLAGQNPDPTKRPHVMNNSWACIEGCAAVTIQQAVEASQAAGIFVEASAGNDGPACSTIAWQPQIYAAAFDTGAIDINNALADFSSRGPVLADGSGRLKPNIAAPGVNVRSSLRGSDTEYGALSGTSMAGPHTVGVVALLWSAHPYLTRQITETKRILESTANPNVTVPDRQTPDCGMTPPSQIPNNYFGYGRIDALAAVNAATPKLVGHLTWQGRPAQPNALNQLPVSLTLQLATTTTHYGFLQTDASGFFTVPVGTLPAGTYSWWVKGPQWLAAGGTLALTGGATTTAELGLQRAGDVDNNNLVDITDFTLLRATFGKVCGDPGYDGRADFTGDCLVDITDFTLQRGNFGQTGPPRPAGPAAAHDQ